jgi:valyl-tRNA synthetase
MNQSRKNNIEALYSFGNEWKMMIEKTSNDLEYEEVVEQFSKKDFNYLNDDINIYIHDFFRYFSKCYCENYIEKTKISMKQYAINLKNDDILFLYYFLEQMVIDKESILFSIEYARRMVPSYCKICFDFKLFENM